MHEKTRLLRLEFFLLLSPLEEETIEREIGDEPDNSQLFSEVADGVTCNGLGDCVSLLRKPDAADPHVRFDERGVNTEAEFR